MTVVRRHEEAIELDFIWYPKPPVGVMPHLLAIANNRPMEQCKRVEARFSKSTRFVVLHPRGYLGTGKRKIASTAVRDLEVV